MQQFTVPQFIDVEDKIIGPITARQFVIMLAGALLIAVCYKILTFTVFLTIGFFIFSACGILAFFKVNGMPFHFFILNFLQTLARPGLRIWDNTTVIVTTSEEISKQKVKDAILPDDVPKPKTASRLSELSLVVDTRGAYRGEEGVDDINIDKKNNQ